MKVHPKTSPSSASWAEAPISPWSQFGDDEWRLDIRTAGRRADQNRVSWSFPPPDESRITAAAWSGLADAAKQFLWSMAVDPPAGRKRLSPASLHIRALLLKTVIGWMALDGLASFREVDRAAVDRLRAWLLARQGRRNRLISARTVAHYMVVLKDLYRQRTKLDNAIVTDPFPEETTYEAAGLTRANKGTIPFIPDAIAIALLNAALKWLEDHGPTIVRAEALRLEARAFGLTRGARQASYHVRKALKRTGLSGALGEPLDGAYAVRHAATHLVEACYIAIAGFVGMRVSEILSIEIGAVEYRPINEAAVEQAYIVARLFKTADQQGGRLERWLAPEPVVKAVALLEQLSAPLRKTSGRRELFLVKNIYGKIVPVTHMHMSWRINDFARHVGICTKVSRGRSVRISSARPLLASLRGAIVPSCWASPSTTSTLPWR